MNSKKLLLAGIFFIALISRAQLPAYVSVNGLQGFWPFSGNANDLSGNNYNGTVFGAVLTTDRFGNANSAYSFSGVSTYILTNYAGILGSNPRSISFWAKSTETLASSYLVGWGDNQPGTRFGAAFFNGVGPIVSPAVGGSYTNLVYTSPSPVSTGQWHHYVFQFNGTMFSQVQIYQDAILLTQVTFSTSPNMLVNTQAGFNVQFGRIDYNPQPEYFNGQIDEIGIWNRMLTQCEISQLYNSALPAIGITSSPIAICAGQSVTLTATGGSNYSWSSTQQNTPSIVVIPNVNSSYAVSGQVNGCLVSGNITLNVEVCAGVSSLPFNAAEIIVFPNPTNGSVNLTGMGEATKLSIYNELGELIYEGTTSGDIVSIDLTNHAAGIYLFKLGNGPSLTTTKIVRQLNE